MTKRAGSQRNGEQRFLAALEKGDHALGWTIARVPFDPARTWPHMIRLRVCGELGPAAGGGESTPFRTSLFPDPRGGFFLLVNRLMQRSAGVAVGAVAEFRLLPDLEDRPAELPEELAVLLDGEAGLRAWYDGLSEYARRQIGKEVLAAHTDTARLHRAEAVAERLLNAMEAEHDLPPLIERALRAKPKAREGWERLTLTQRRSELMAVFHYVSPEARARRVAKLVEAALARAAKP